MRRVIFAVGRNVITTDHKHEHPLDDIIKKLIVINDTPKGYRCEVSYSARGTVYRHSHWHFFISMTDAVYHVANTANRVASDLEMRKLALTRLLCEAHDILRAEADKVSTCGR